MKRETYRALMQFFQRHAALTGMIHMANRILTGIVFLSYVLLLFYFFWNRDTVLLRAIIVPVDALILVSLLRYFINRRRPYEVFEMDAVIPKHTKGNSFPSRHVFSVFMIAMTYLCLCPWHWAGIALLVCGCLLAAVRVVSGLHFFSDVLAGAAAGVLAGIVGYLLF